MLNAFAECDPNLTKRLEWIRMFCKSEGDCTSETGAGQFSIFGAVEEKSVGGFSRNDTAEWESEGELGELWMALFSHEWGCEREIGCSEREECPQGVHRKCRKEGAQLPVAGGPLPILATRRAGQWGVNHD